jgi:alpha-L-fucosidase 2
LRLNNEFVIILKSNVEGVNKYMNKMKKMKKCAISTLLAAAMSVTSISVPVNGFANEVTAAKDVREDISMILRYDEPASDWESEALPIGNGNIGAMIFGGVDSEKIQINENSLWSGGPGSSNSYDGGENELSTEQVHEALQNARQSLQDMVTDFAENKAAYVDDSGKIVSNNYTDLLNDSAFSSNLEKLKGEKNNFGSYQTFGNLVIDNPQGTNTYSNYLRTSDINRAVETVTYTQDGVDYKREYFANNPNNVIVAKLTASEAGKMTRDISLNSEQTKKTISVNESDASITMEGRPSDQREDGLNFAGYLKVIAEGGTVSKSDNSTLSVNGADSIVIIMSVGTNWKSDPTTEYNYFEDDLPIYKVEDWVNAAVEKGYDTLYNEHVADYKKLYDRCSINIGAVEVPDKMTDDLLSDYGKNNSKEEDRYLETLFFQYGRYLLISSSRENSKLPANLQGIWAQGLTPPWSSDYHTNINLQMNYWLAEQTSLSECHQVVIDYINDMVEKGKVTAQKYYCKQDGSDVRGWVIHHENNIWGNTNPSNFTTAFYFPAAAAWQCQDIWEAYQFNSNKELLAKYYDTMLQAALFWVDNLWVDERDGTLVANPSYSPEHGVYSIGTTCDQAIIWELFDEVIKASEVLGKSGDSEIAEIKEAKEKLYMPKADTLGGQYREWKDETTLEITNSDGHRHQNQLYVLHPGTYVVAGRSEEDDALLEAARVTLEKRGDGGTGWSKAWKINMWARLRDGDRALKLYGEQLTGSTLSNLFDTHAPFQIDGNFGATSGVAEMLLQSQGNYIEPLAALPWDWSDGSYTGLRARGDFDISAAWKDGMVDELKIVSGSGNECKIRYTGLSGYKVANITTGKYVNPSKIDNDTISFPTEAGNEYMIAYDIPAEIIKPDVPVNNNNNNNNPDVTAEPVGGNNGIVTADKPSSEVALKTPVIKSVTSNKKKAMTVTIKKKVKQASGYEIRYSAKKNMKASKYVKINKGTILKKSIKKLKSGKKYYVQVRAVKKSGTDKYYSKWSKKKNVKVK